MIAAYLMFLFHAARNHFLCFLSLVTIWLVPGIFTQQISAQSAAKTFSAEQAGRKLYAEHVQPVLERHCQACHNGAAKQGGLDLKTREELMHGGSRGPAVVPGHSKDSLLYKLITHHQQPNMPLRGEKILDETSALIALWIDLGAPYDATMPAS